jgi:hypothetical protein
MKIKIGFVGSPLSGKTTTAAHLFAELKSQGLPVEFLPEYARNYIRDTRKEAFIQGGRPAALGDEDQLRICRGQYDLEHDIMAFSGSQIVLVTDGCTLNAHFYTSRDILDPNKMLQQYDLLFFARNIERPSLLADGNRVHDAQFSAACDARINEFLNGAVCPNVIELKGDVQERLSDALRAVARLLDPRHGVRV